MHGAQEHVALEQIVLKEMPLFSRGKELLQLEIFKMVSDDPRRMFCIDDFIDIEKNKRKIRDALNALVGRGRIKMIKSYPRFYCLVVK